MTNGYLIPIFVAILIIVTHVIFSQKLKYDKRFSNDLANRLYALSYVKPFEWFINPDEKDSKVKKDEELIKKAGLEHVFNYRSLTTLQVMLFITVLFIYLIILLFMNEIMWIMDFLFRIDSGDAGTSFETRIVIGIMLLVTLLIPKYYIKNKAKKNAFYFTQDLPVVQLSIILMLRANRPMSDIMYTLGQNQTRYRKLFEKAHRIYLRDKQQCWDFLRNEFKGTGFEDTIDVLAGMDNFSKAETIRVLENGMEYLMERSNDKKRSGAAIGNLFSQFSMAIPFGGVLLLGAVPYAMYIFDMMSDGIQF